MSYENAEKIADANLTSKQATVTALYRVLLHPLKHYPGPLVYRISRLGWAYHMCRGDWIYRVLEMHEKYGPVVRVAPDELSFIAPEAWRDIYGSRPGFGDLPKAIHLFRPSRWIQPSLLVTQDRTEHRSLRSRIIPSFTESALRLQEPQIIKYSSLLVTKLRDICDSDLNKAPLVDISRWYSTYDVPFQLSNATQGSF
jgi:hypothetical protein